MPAWKEAYYCNNLQHKTLKLTSVIISNHTRINFIQIVVVTRDQTDMELLSLAKYNKNDAVKGHKSERECSTTGKERNVI
jgi:hypothetical protein